MSRFLPDSIHRFTPYINYGDGNTKGISREQIIERSRVWLGGLTTEIQTRGREVLSLLDTAQSLAKARGEAWAVLQITPTSGVRPEWDQTCQNAFGQTFCLWRDVFRDLFNLRSQEIIKAAFIPLLRFHAEVLVPILTEIEGQTEEKNIGKFVWTEQDDKSAGVIADRSHAFTPAVLRVQQAVDLRLLQIKADVDHIFLIDPPPAGDSPDQDVYHITSDSLILKNSLQRACVDAILEFKTSLEKQVVLRPFPPTPPPTFFLTPLRTSSSCKSSMTSSSPPAISQGTKCGLSSLRRHYSQGGSPSASPPGQRASTPSSNSRRRSLLTAPNYGASISPA